MATIAEMIVEIKVSQEQANREIEKLKNKMVKSNKEMTNAIRGTVDAFKIFVGAAVVKKTFEWAKAFLTLSGDIDSVSASFENLAKNATGGSRGLLKAIQIATKGTVDNLEIMRTSNMAIQLLGEEAIGTLPRIAEIAAAAARTTGQDVSKAFNDIIVAAGRQSVQVLDNLNISSAKASQEMDNYAKKLGTTVDKLSDAEKKQAFFNAVLVAGDEILTKAGNKGITFGESMQRLRVAFGNIANSIAKQFAPSLAIFAEGLTNIIQKIQDLRLAYLKFQRIVGDISLKLAITDRERVLLLKEQIRIQGIINDIKKEEGIQYQQVETLKFKASLETINRVKEEEFKKNYQVFQNALGYAQQTVSQLTGIFNQYYTNKAIAIDNEQYREQNKIDAGYNAEKARIEAEITDEKEQAAALKSLDEKKARDEDKLNKKIEKQRRKAAREAAIYQKAISISSSIINTALAIGQAIANLPPPYSFAAAAISGALGAAQTALIAAQPLPEAQEGLFTNRPAIFGEAGPEIAVPLSGDQGRNAIRELASGMLDVMSQNVDTRATVSETQSAAGSGGNVYLDGTLVGQWLSKGSTNGLFTIDRRVIVT